VPTNFNFTSLFWNVLFTLIIIYFIRVVAISYNIPFLKNVVTYQVPAQGGL
jgi:hypothetical protein